VVYEKIDHDLAHGNRRGRRPRRGWSIGGGSMWAPGPPDVEVDPTRLRLREYRAHALYIGAAVIAGPFRATGRTCPVPTGSIVGYTVRVISLRSGQVVLLACNTLGRVGCGFGDKKRHISGAPVALRAVRYLRVNPVGRPGVACSLSKSSVLVRTYQSSIRGPWALKLIAILCISAAACGRPAGLTSAAELPPPVEGPYRVQVADVLSVRFFRTPELTQEVTVGPDGAITLSLIGSVIAAGRELDELTEGVRTLYSRAQLTDPQITISVRTFSGLRVYVGGEVTTPGMLEYRGGLTLVQAIMQAGGFSDTARRGQVLVIRKGADGGPVGTQVNVGSILSDARFGTDVALAPSDIVFVPRSAIANLNLFVEQYVYNNLPISLYLGFDVRPR